MRKRLLITIAAVGYSRVVVAVVQLVLVPVLALNWGLPLYGQWILLSTIPVFLASGGGDFGFGSAAGNRIIGEVATGRTDEALRTFQSAWRLVLLLTPAVACIGLAICFLLPDRLLSIEGGMQAAEARQVLVVLALYGAVSLFGSLFSAVAKSAGKQAASITMIATCEMLEYVAVLLVALSGGKPLHAAIGCLAVRCVGQACFMAHARWVAPWLRIGGKEARMERVRELLRPALAAMWWPIGQTAYLQGTAMAVGAAGGAGMVPIFTSLRTLSRLGLHVMMMLSVPLMPEYTAAHAQGNRHRLEVIGGIVGTINLAVGAAIGLGLALLGGPVMDLWTKGAIRPPQEMLILTGIGLTLQLLWTTLANMLVAINRHEAFTYTFMALVAGTIALTYVLVSEIGVTGVAVATLILEAAMVWVILASLRKNVGPVKFGRSSLMAIIPHRWRTRREPH